MAVPLGNGLPKTTRLAAQQNGAVRYTVLCVRRYCGAQYRGGFQRTRVTVINYTMLMIVETA